MKYGEVVTYVRNGVALNALVLHSQQAVDGERLILAYPDPTFESAVLSGTNTQKAVATAFDVKPFVEGANQGWAIVAPSSDVAFDSAIQWRKYAEALEQSAIADGHQIPIIAGDQTRTTFPSLDDEEADKLRAHVEAATASLAKSDVANG